MHHLDKAEGNDNADLIKYSIVESEETLKGGKCLLSAA